MNPKIIFLMGVSGSGKTSVINELLKDDIFHYVPSYTTRPLREGEINGEKYHHITKEEFEQGIASGSFLEYATVHQKYYYGTKVKPLRQAANDDFIPIKEIEIQGLEQIVEQNVLNPREYKTIFLDIDDIVVTQRILSRQPNIDADELQYRLDSAEAEREKAESFCDHILDASDSLGIVVEQVRRIIQNP